MPQSGNAVAHCCCDCKPIDPERIRNRFGAQTDRRIQRATSFLPEHFLVIRILIRDVPVQTRVEFQVGGPFQHFCSYPHKAKFLLGDADEALKNELDFRSIALAFPNEAAVQYAALHVQFHVKIRDRLLRQIKRFAIDKDSDSNEVHGIDDFPEIFRVAVLPPAHTRFVGIPHARQVGSFMGIA